MTRVPVLLLTGFLGSGKTTLLNAVTRDPAFRDTAFVINEAGDVGLDHLLVEAGEDEVVLLEGGCLCCRMQGSLSGALDALWRRRGRDGAAPFTRIVVETSGLADPAPILRGLLEDAAFRRRFDLAGVVTAVDAARFEQTVAAHPEAGAQVALADRLLITKADLVGEADIEQLAATLAARNPVAEQAVARSGSISASAFWPATLGLAAAPRRPRPVATGAGDGRPVAIVAQAFAGRLSEDAVEAWLDHTMDLFGLSLIRLKALLHVESRSEPIVLQGVQGLLNSSTGPRSPSGLNRVVLIGHGIDDVLLRDAIARLAEGASAVPPGRELAP